MKNTGFIKLISILLCVASMLGVLSACSSKREPVKVGSDNNNSLVSLKWIIAPTMEYEAIEPLVRADYNDSTRHYDISYADCFKIKQNGKYGIIDYNGKTVIKPKYDSIVAIRNS